MSSSRRQYPFHLIEPKWQKNWDEQQTFRAWNPNDEIPASHPFAARHKISGKVAATQLPQKFYILDMFPYPSGAGLHVGHPEGYTATDILARYRRACGFNVLHPMGWDSFGLPAEQYAVKTGQHPRKTTEENIANFTRQIKSLGFSYDWSRELATTDVDYFKWTQWIFLKLYNSWFNPKTNRAEPIETLEYPAGLRLPFPNSNKEEIEALEFNRRIFRDSKRLAYVKEAPVWWCEQLGTVLANEEVVDGKSEVGGFPVVRKLMRQWMLRITAYAEKLLTDLESIDWSDSLKEMQRNWIGKSEGAYVSFGIEGRAKSAAEDAKSSTDSDPDIINWEEIDTFIQSASQRKTDSIWVFTTRPDTLFGATYMVLAPEHPLVDELTTDGQRSAVESYRVEVAKKSDLQRTDLAKEKTGVWIGAYAINPLNGEKIPIWIADYVLASYGTGAIMAVPAHDQRDYEFAAKYNLPIPQVVVPETSEVEKLTLFLHETKCSHPLRVVVAWSDEGKIAEDYAFDFEGINVNSANSEISLNGLPTSEAKKKITAWLEEKNLGKRTINYKLRDWLFSRQRYWGEPFPIVWKKDAAGNLFHEAIPEKSLPVLPPQLDDYKPTTDGQPPLARAVDWVKLKSGAERETNTMPQWAGSCWYYLRYLDARNPKRFVSRAAEHYWMGADLPVGTARCLSAEEWRRELAALEAVAFQETSKQIPRSVLFSEVSPRLSDLIRDASGEDVSDFWHSLDALHLRHIGKHSNIFLETRRGNLPVTEEDLLRLPEILADPDSVEFSAISPGGFKRFVISKRMNGTVFVVEEMRGRERQLQVLTFWKKTATAKDVIAKMPLSDTSENDRRTKRNKTENARSVKATPGVDLYVGGTEHAVLHLLYARFWHKVLFDLGYVSTPEPFFKLVNQGLILGEDGQKMSKSRGNVINPDDILVEYGADAFRLYEMFMGPLQDSKPWSTKGVEGVYRFLGRVWRLFADEKSETAFEQAEAVTAETQRRGELLDLILLDGAITDAEASPTQLKTLHACIKKVTEDLDAMRFNTAISAMMVFVNEAMTWQNKPFAAMKTFLQLLAPFAPHLAEELWARLHSTFGQIAPSLTYAPWPNFDPALLVESEIEMPVSVDGKVRDVIKVSVDADSAALEAAAKASEKVQQFIAGKSIKKVIIVPKKMVNLIVAP